MRRMIRRASTIWAVIILTTPLASNVASQETSIKRSDLPPGVQKTADVQGKGAIVRGYTSEIENGKKQYEVQLLVKGHAKDVTIDPSGKVLEIEEQVPLEQLSPSVKVALQKRVGHGRILKVESLVKNGKLVAYEAQLIINGKKSEAQVGPNGESLSHEE